ncbi:MAG TPA: hypothetical protein VEO37_04265, partial [Thermoanaerobaculia bacterium]|nr:hypothetical protein [Thermoanaerobaculia bacterium]
MSPSQTESMTPERLEEIRQAFDALTDLPEEERRARLEQWGPRDSDLRARVEKLLEAHFREHPLLDGRAADLLGLS